MAEMLFFGSILVISYTYFGYPISLYLAGCIWGKDVEREMIIPLVTFIITVHNEEKRVSDKLENTLDLDYPKEKLHILVASDGSNDHTNEIVRDYVKQGIQLLAIADRRGKENAQREAVKISSGDIVVFSDVATMLERHGLKRLVSNFADQTVGCVSSEDRLLGQGEKPSGEGVYVRYEMWLRRLESRANSLVGLSGSLFAARKEACEDFSGDMQSDFRTLLNSIKLGLRGVCDPLAVGFYHDTADQEREWNRKIRTVVRGLTVFFRHVDLLNISKYGFFSYQLFCHKLLRWSVPFLMISAFVSNVVLSVNSLAYFIVLWCHALFYGLGFLGLCKKDFQDITLIRIPAYFVEVNTSILVGWWLYLRGYRIVAWAPTVR